MTANADLNSNHHSIQDANLGSSGQGQHCTKIFEFLLTTDQAKQFQKFVPAGYTIALSKSIKPTKRISNAIFNIEESRMSSNVLEKQKRDAYYKAEQKIKEPVEFMKRCEYILNCLKKHKSGFPFLEPVDPEILGIPDYFQIIKEPMDFSKVEKRLRSAFYKTPVEFEEDVRKIWDNATTYNKPNTEIYHMTLEISQFFERILVEEETVFPVPPTSKLPVPKTQKRIVEYDSVDGPFKPSKTTYASKPSTDRPLTYQEKKALSEMIRQLPSESLWEVWKIVSPENQNQGEELEFDIDTLSPRTSRELERFVKSKLQILSNKKSKPKSAIHFKETIPPFSNQNGVAVQQSLPVSQGQPVMPLGQTREVIGPLVPKESHLNKDDTSNSSFLSNLSESDY